MERPLTILEHFVFDRTEHHVEIVWKDSDPLFKASDIGKVLGLKKIRNSIAGFDATEKEAHTVGTPGGPQEVLMLTEDGLVKLILRSRKPVAQPLMKWVIHVIKKIQRAGHYENQELRKALERAKESEEEAKESEQKAKRALKDTEKNIEATVRAAEHHSLMQAFQMKHIVYFGRIREIDGKMLVKIGATKDVVTTFNIRHPKDYGPIKLIAAFQCQTNRQLEYYLLHHNIIEQFRYKEPVKLDGGRSNEVVLVDKNEFEKMLRITKGYITKFPNAWSVADELQGMREDIQNLTLNFASKTEDNTRPSKKRSRTKGPGNCPGCNMKISPTAQFCVECAQEFRPKKFQVTKDELHDLVWVQKLPFTKIGKKFGVSDNAVRKRCKKLGVEILRRKKGYRSKKK